MLINQQIQTKAVPNPYSHLPSVTTEELVQLMRIDKTMGSDRIASYIADAYDNINCQLSSANMIFAEQINKFVYQTCGGVYFNNANLMDRWQRSYRRAVLNEAAALMADNYLDFDTTGNGLVRGENQQEKSDRLRRIVNHAIADLTGRSRNRVSLL